MAEGLRAWATLQVMTSMQGFFIAESPSYEFMVGVSCVGGPGLMDGGL